MRARWLVPGDEPLAWSLLVGDPGFNLPALYLLERQGLGGPARFLLAENPDGLPLWGAAGIDGRWFLFRGYETGAAGSLRAPAASLLAASGIGILEGEARLVLGLLRDAAAGPYRALQRHAVARLGATIPERAPIPNLQVRPARMGELPLVERLYREQGETVDPVALTEAARSGDLWIAAASEGPLGAAMAPTRTRLAAWIGAVYTHPAHRRRGIASALVASLARSLQSQGLAVYLLYRPGGPSALYRALGFTPTGNWIRAELSP